MPWEDAQAREQVARAEELLSGLEKLPDSAAAARALETVEALVDLYGDCLARIMGHLADEADDGAQGDGAPGDGAAGDGGAARRIADDELVGHLLLVHDLHPDPVEARVRRALELIRPYLQSQGSDVELLELSDTAVRVRLPAGRGCSSSSAPLEEAVRDSVRSAAPEIERVETETTQPAAPQTLIPVDALFKGRTLTGHGTG
ncbi:NifU family protein [Streptomyces sp. NPDC004647]|uniref:NifU family protein n=1 Tax=Streptomyces sp. NPDC004647 TaxID=3154671 RepID=UPI0033B09995